MVRAGCLRGRQTLPLLYMIRYSTVRKKGALVKITSAFKCFRSADVNKYIRFPKADDSGEYASFRVVTYKNAKRITARLKHKMSKEDYPIVNGETDADKIEDRKKKPDVESGMWSLESKSWTDALGLGQHMAAFIRGVCGWCVIMTCGLQYQTILKISPLAMPQIWVFTGSLVVRKLILRNG